LSGGPDEDTGVGRRFRGGADRWDQIYSEGGSPLARVWDRLTRQNVRRRFLRAFEAAGDLTGKSVLDLGCGSGRYLIEAAHRGATRVVGIDFSPEMIGIAGRLAAASGQGARIEVRCESIETVSFELPFDVVIANGLFDYLDDAAREFNRAVGWTNGVLVASFPDRAAPRALPRSLYWRTRGIRIRLFDDRSIRRLAEGAGIQAYEIERIGPIFLLVAHVDR
jgi:SAM-dependent methyltransferase